MSAIEWTERTWNPVVGCTKISPGCKHCYAETMHGRLNLMQTRGYDKPFTTVRCLPERLEIPLRTSKPTMWFVNSMSDLFHEDVGCTFIDRVFDVMCRTQQHTYQVLTKRAERMRHYMTHDYPFGAHRLANTWLGVSVEDARHGKPRMDSLRGTPAGVRFLSCEPLLGSLGELDLRRIDWVIVGGESGRKARPMRPEWVESIRRQCAEQGVAFFFKQWGRWGEDGIARSKKANGRLFRGKVWEMMPIPDSPSGCLQRALKTAS